jgi:YtkA-like
MKHLAAIGFSLLALSCGGGSGDQNTGLDAGDVIDCSADPRVFTYTAGMTVASASKALTFALVQSSPAPPAKGNDVWTLKVTNSSGAAQPNLGMSVLPFMPDHGHGTSVNASITDNKDGTYTVTPLYFFMPGVWRITFSTATPSDSAVFFFCVPG